MWGSLDAGDILRVTTLLLCLGAILSLLIVGRKHRRIRGQLVPLALWLIEASLFYILLLMYHAGMVTIETTMLNHMSTFLRMQIPMMIIGGAVIYMKTDGKFHV